MRIRKCRLRAQVLPEQYPSLCSRSSSLHLSRFYHYDRTSLEFSSQTTEAETSII